MRRVVVILLLALGATILAAVYLAQTAGDARRRATLELLRKVSVEGFLLSEVRFEEDGSLVFEGTAEGRTYADASSSRLLAGEVMREAARVCLERSGRRFPPKAAVLLRPREDLLLTDRIPSERRFEREFFAVLAERAISEAAPGALVTGWEEGVLRLVPGEEGLDALLPAVRELAASDLFRRVKGFEVADRLLDRPLLHVVSAAAEAGHSLSEVLVDVVDADTGKVICFAEPACELPVVFPAPLTIDMPETVDALNIEEALLDAYKEAAEEEAKGVYVNIAGASQYQDTPTIRLRVEEKRDIVAWGDRRFKVGGKHYAGWKYVIIHHTATENATFRSIDEYHREVRGWEHGAGYHFIIGNGQGIEDGKVFPTPRWKEQLTGSHAGGPKWNRMSIGIALVGNFEETKPTGQQMESLVKLSHYLARRFNIPAEKFMGHRDCPVASTLCPGKDFPFEEFKRQLQEALKVRSTE